MEVEHRESKWGPKTRLIDGGGGVVDNRGGYAGIGAEGIWEVSVFVDKIAVSQKLL